MNPRAFTLVLLLLGLLLMAPPCWVHADSFGFEAGYGVEFVAGADNDFNHAAISYHKQTGARSYLELRGGHLNGGAILSGSIGLQAKHARFQPFTSVGLAWVETPPKGFLTGATQFLGTAGVRHWYCDRYAVEVIYRHISNGDWADLGQPPNTGVDHVMFGLRVRID